MKSQRISRLLLADVQDSLVCWLNCLSALALISGCGTAVEKDVLRVDATMTDRTAIAGPGNAPSAEKPGLHNLVQIVDGTYSGSEPHGEKGFESLDELGIKTIVSVDGARPHVALARSYGMRYVHIPIGYDGIPKKAGESLARLVREAEGPIYFHCHHGKHRGPAAAAVACVASGEVDGKGALHILKRAGTSRDYAGLWRGVATYQPPPLDAELPELVEIAEIESFTVAMAQVDRSFDNLKLCRDAGWSELRDHPDIDAAQEALLVQEGLHEAGRNIDAGYGAQVKSWLVASEDFAKELRTVLSDQNPDLANEKFRALEQSCRQCHRAYRD